MSINPPMTTGLLALDAKTAAIAEFIMAHLPAILADGVQGHEITLLARSPESPAALALVRVGQELAETNVGVRVIFATPSTQGWTGDAGGDAMAFARSVRLTHSPKLLDAHEQLVVGPATCWIGDCMRRDPAKRDAFEQFKDDCATTTAFATTSFDRLWRVSKPVAAPVTKLVQDAAFAALSPVSRPVDNSDSRED